MRQTKLQAGVLVCILVAIFNTGTAMAHGKVAMEKDTCMRRIGDNIIHFSAYQPQVDKSKQYCTEIPKAGNAIFVVDLVDPALRNMPVGVQIIRGQNEKDGESIINIHPTQYVDGVINTQTMLDAGEYLVAVTAEGMPPLKYSYRLRVEMINYENVFRAAIGPFMGLLFILILGYILMKTKRFKNWKESRRQSKVPK